MRNKTNLGIKVMWVLSFTLLLTDISFGQNQYAGDISSRQVQEYTGDSKPVGFMDVNLPSGIHSPYDDIDWNNVVRLKFDGHVHARRGSTVKDVVHEFDRMGYDVIAFKDTRSDGRIHYPMDEWGVNMEDYQIMVIPGQGVLPYSDEAPFMQHMKVWFYEESIDWRIKSFDYEEAIKSVGDKDGLIVFAHPGSEIYPMYSVIVGADWYIHLFDTYEHVLGFEVNNHDPEKSQKLFDELLKHYGSSRLIVGFGSSDTQGLREDGSIGSAGGNFGLSLVLADGNDRNAFRDAIEAGRLFWITTPEPDINTREITFPSVEKIEITDDQITLQITGEYDEIRWIYDNKVISKGRSFKLEDVTGPEQNYVRFEIAGDNNNIIVGSQAFYITP